MGRGDDDNMKERRDMAKQRLFTAVLFEPPFVEALVGAQAAMRGGLRGGVSWTKEENLHATLHFLGDVEDEQMGTLEDGLRVATEAIAPFSLRLGPVGFFGSHRDPRILWGGLEGAGLQALHAAGQKALADRGFRTEERPYHPHVTLGRVIRAEKVAPLFVEALARCAIPPLEQAVVSMALMRSSLLAGGAVYTPIQRFALNAAA